MKNFYKIPLAASLLIALMSAPTLAGFYVIEGKNKAVPVTKDNYAQYQGYTVYEWEGEPEAFTYQDSMTPVDVSDGFLDDPQYVTHKKHYIFYKAN
ncbi:MAG: hypothetical protein H0X26_08720 [Alphaproteobacteria bacterium]|nr:hypothetical protein [Alphaproteobacteria bacterium]